MGKQENGEGALGEILACINFSSSVPVFVQIQNRIRFVIAAGGCSPGIKFLR